MKKQNMKKQSYKIQELISLLLAGIVIVGGVYALLTAPAQRMANDQQQLQLDLLKNAALLKAQRSTTGPPQTVPELYEQQDAENNFSSDDVKNITIIGDSVMLGAACEIQKVFPGGVVDAKESRQAWDAATVIEELKTQGKLRNMIVVALGSNGSFSQNTGQEVLNAIGRDHTIYWVVPYGKNLGSQADIARILGELAEENDNLIILDWPGTAEEHPEWFYSDGMHLNASGQKGYAAFLFEAIDI